MIFIYFFRHSLLLINFAVRPSNLILTRLSRGWWNYFIIIWGTRSAAPSPTFSTWPPLRKGRTLILFRVYMSKGIFSWQHKWRPRAFLQMFVDSHVQVYVFLLLHLFLVIWIVVIRIRYGEVSNKWTVFLLKHFIKVLLYYFTIEEWSLIVIIAVGIFH